MRKVTFLIFILISSFTFADDASSFEIPSACELQRSYADSSAIKGAKIRDTYLLRYTQEFNQLHRGGEPSREACDKFLEISDSINIIKYHYISSISYLNQLINDNNSCENDSDLKNLKKTLSIVEKDLSRMESVMRSYLMAVGPSCILLD